MTADVGALPTVFISHTTRDRRDHRLAQDLDAGLRSRGARTWIAPDSIPPGEEWEHELVRSIVEECSHFLVIISAQSADAPWVVKEVELALERLDRDPGFTVLPLWVGQPGEFEGRERLETLQRLPYHDRLPVQMDELARALGLRPSAHLQLPPAAATDFVGREYVFDAIAEFISEHDRGYFVVQGEPGSGKTALLAEFVTRSGSVAHFNVAGLGVNSAAAFIGNVGEQLIRRHALPYTELPDRALEDGSFLRRLLHEAAADLRDGEALVVAVDALDEVDMTAQTAGSNVLYLPPRLPPGVFVVTTRRPVEVPLIVYTPIELYDLDDHLDETLVDIAAYIRISAEREPLRAWLSASPWERDEFVDVLAHKSEGNFMYVRYVLPEIAAAADSLELDDLPVGLEAYYREHWVRMGMTAKPLPRIKLRIVYVLSVVPHPVSRALLARFASNDDMAIDELTVQEVIDEWAQFLHSEPSEYGTVHSIYHASFRDFLHAQETTQAAGLSLPAVTASIANPLFDELFDDG